MSISRFYSSGPISYCLGETTGVGINIAKKTYWNTLSFLLSALLNLGLCLVLIPRLGAAGAAIAFATSGIVTLIVRTVIGERYYKVVRQYRYLFYTVGTMLAASIANYLLQDAVVWKYAALITIYALAVFLFRKEIAILWNTARQMLRGWLRGRKAKANGHA